jgi:hypothetical protein
MHPGPVRDRLTLFLTDWLGLLESAVREAQGEATIDHEDPEHLVFEIEAAILLANAQYVMVRTSEPIERAPAGGRAPTRHVRNRRGSRPRVRRTSRR